MTSFQGGDIVKDPYIFTGEGVVTRIIRAGAASEIQVRAGNNYYWYDMEGKYTHSAETPSLVLVRRPLKVQPGIWLLENGDTAIVMSKSHVTLDSVFTWSGTQLRSNGSYLGRLWSETGKNKFNPNLNLKTFIGPLPTKKDEE